MNMLVRRIAVLSVVWAMCELLLPDGRHQQLVRMTAGLLVMTALLSAAGEWFNSAQPLQVTAVQQAQQVSEGNYMRTALAAVANQMEDCCVKMARRAGYQAGACVYLTMEGSVDHIELSLWQSPHPLMAPEELRAALAQYLSVSDECIWLSMEAL